MSMWKYVVVLCVVTACSGRPQTDPDECDGIYCEESDDLTQTYYDGEEGDEENGSNGTSSLARQALYYRSRPSRQVVIRRINFSGVRANGRRAPSRVNFQNVVVNTGKAWKSNGRFVAPFEGGYFFAFHGISARNSNFTVNLMRNNRTRVWAYGRRGRYQHGSTSAFLMLRRGDVMTLRVTKGALYENPYVNSYNSFTALMMYRADGA